jgi:hypothetical protein
MPDDPSQRVTAYLLEQIASFVAKPPDTEFRRGYLVALLDVYDEGLDGPPDAAVEDARLLYTDRL